MGATSLKKDYVDSYTPVLSIFGWMLLLGDIPWWRGVQVVVRTTEFHVLSWHRSEHTVSPASDWMVNSLKKSDYMSRWKVFCGDEIPCGHGCMRGGREVSRGGFLPSTVQIPQGRPLWKCLCSCVRHRALGRRQKLKCALACGPGLPE